MGLLKIPGASANWVSQSGGDLSEGFKATDVFWRYWHTLFLTNKGVNSSNNLLNLNSAMNKENQIITIVNQSDLRISVKKTAELVVSIYAELQKHKVLRSRTKPELTLVFLNMAAAKKINLQFRKKNYATDILSFESTELNVLGELILCPQVLKKQAKEHGLTFNQELTYMLIHGILHLLGYEHETSPKDAKKMFTPQDRIFDALI